MIVYYRLMHYIITPAPIVCARNTTDFTYYPPSRP